MNSKRFSSTFVVVVVLGLLLTLSTVAPADATTTLTASRTDGSSTPSESSSSSIVDGARPTMSSSTTPTVGVSASLPPTLSASLTPTHSKPLVVVGTLTSEPTKTQESTKTPPSATILPADKNGHRTATLSASATPSNKQRSFSASQSQTTLLKPTMSTALGTSSVSQTWRLTTSASLSRLPAQQHHHTFTSSRTFHISGTVSKSVLPRGAQAQTSTKTMMDAPNSQRRTQTQTVVTPPPPLQTPVPGVFAKTPTLTLQAPAYHFGRTSSVTISLHDELPVAHKTMTRTVMLSRTLLTPPLTTTAAPTTMAPPTSSPPTPPPETPQPEQYDVIVQLSLSGDFSAVFKSNETKQQMKTSVQKDIAKTLGVDEHRVTILCIAQGSLIVDFKVSDVTNVSETTSKIEALPSEDVQQEFSASMATLDANGGNSADVTVSAVAVTDTVLVTPVPSTPTPGSGASGGSKGGGSDTAKTEAWWIIVAIVAAVFVALLGLAIVKGSQGSKGTGQRVPPPNASGAIAATGPTPPARHPQEMAELEVPLHPPHPGGGGGGAFAQDHAHHHHPVMVRPEQPLARNSFETPENQRKSAPILDSLL